MKKMFTFVIAAASLALASCASLPNISPGGPAAVAESTTLDERLLLGAETSYKAARTLGEVAVDTGEISPAMAVQFRSVDIALFGVLLKARTAYDAGNAVTYKAALDEMAPLLNRIWAIVRPRRGEGAVP